MSSVYFSAELAVEPGHAWSVLEAYSRGENQIFAIVADVVMEGNVRVITTAHGDTMREHILSVDPDHLRLCYTIPGWSPDTTYHFAAMEILPRDGGGCQLRWITDYWPSRPLGAEHAEVYRAAFADLSAAIEKAQP